MLQVKSSSAEPNVETLVEAVRRRWQGEFGDELPRGLENAWRAELRELGRRQPLEVLRLAVALQLDREQWDSPRELVFRLADAKRAWKRRVSVKALQAAREWIAQHGRPTGVKFVHGSHSGMYVLDPLGHDRLPYDQALPGVFRPTLLDVAVALVVAETTER